MDNYYLLHNWVTNVTLGSHDGRQLPPTQYLEIKYEKLVKRSERTARQICEFLNENYSQRMLNHVLLANQIGPGPDGHTEVMKPISTNSVGRWHSQFPPFEKKMAYRIAGATLEKYGYANSPQGKFTGIEKIRNSALIIKYGITASIRHILYTTGFLTLNRNMRQDRR